jgi:CRP-like cAMP-binding protein
MMATDVSRASRDLTRDTTIARNEHQATEQNRLLRQLGDEAYERLRPQLETVQLRNGQVIWEPNARIHSVYFPRTCVMSLIVVLEDDTGVESATVGREGMLGVPLALGVESTSSRAIAQVDGEAARMTGAALRQAMADEPSLNEIVLRYTQVLLEQTAQSVACNRRHSIEERCARWLMMTRDRVGRDEFHLTHEFLALMLGTRRASVTVAAGMLQRAGLLTYTRGRVRILEREGLAEASCECYRVVKEKSEQLLGPNGG